MGFNLNETGTVEEACVEKPKGLGIRHFQIILLFGALLFGYFLRVNMSVALVAMTSNGTNTNVDYYEWDHSTKQLIFSSFFWGYVVAQLPSGLLAEKYGPKIILTIGTMLCALFTVLTPYGARLGDWQLMCALRCLVGFTQGVVYPCVHTALSVWVPRTERSFLCAFVYSGAQLGTVIMLALSGVLTNSAVGWPSIFYFSSTISFGWAVGYLIFGSNVPENAMWISENEKVYIKSLTGNTHKKDMQVPWKSLFTSVPFIALIFAHCGFTWGFYTLLTEIPSYMNKVLEMDIEKNALLSALPYFTMWILCLVVGPIADVLINKGITTVELSRKIFNSIGQWVPMVCLIGVAYMTKETSTIAVLLLTLGVGFNAASFCGYIVNHMDLSPNYAGTMMGITNGLSNLLSIFAPIVVGAVVVNESDPADWRIIFFITAGVYLVCNLIFVIFGKAEIQPWNDNELLNKSINNNEHVKEDSDMAQKHY